METGEIKKYYIWETTSRRGKVETYLAETEDTVYFESGRFVSKAEWDSGALRLIDEAEYLKIAMRENAMQVPVQEPQFDMNMLNGPSVILNDPPINEINEKPKEEINPIRLILDKQKKKETIAIPIEIEVNLPMKKVMSLLDMMFDRDEVTQEIIKSVTSSIDVDSIVNKIESQIRASIESSYDDESIDKKEQRENEM